MSTIYDINIFNLKFSQCFTSCTSLNCICHYYSTQFYFYQVIIFNDCFHQPKRLIEIQNLLAKIFKFFLLSNYSWLPFNQAIFIPPSFLIPLHCFVFLKFRFTMLIFLFTAQAYPRLPKKKNCHHWVVLVANQSHRKGQQFCDKTKSTNP